MRTLLPTVVLVGSALLIGCGGSIPAASAPGQAAAPASPGPKAPGEAKIGDTSTCPVSHEEFVVSDASPKVEYQGKTYYFCCSGCAKKFGADPQKFLSKPAS